jgi:hypothetical protein
MNFKHDIQRNNQTNKQTTNKQRNNQTNKQTTNNNKQQQTTNK